MLQSTRGPPPPLDPPNLAPFSFHSAAAAFPPPSRSLPNSEWRLSFQWRRRLPTSLSPPPSTLRPAVITRLKCLLMKQISSLPPSLPSGALERNGMPHRPPPLDGRWEIIEMHGGNARFHFHCGVSKKTQSTNNAMEKGDGFFCSPDANFGSARSAGRGRK